MDQIKIGKFIASLRKEKGLTQMMLADRLGISDKTVSKWECGAGLPDVSLMLPLCEALEISVNELLTGEKLTDADYKKKAEVTIMNLVQENKENKKRLLHQLFFSNQCNNPLVLKSTCGCPTGLISSGSDIHYMPFPESAAHWKTLADGKLHGTCNIRNPQSIPLVEVYCNNCLPSSKTNEPLFLQYLQVL